MSTLITQTLLSSWLYTYKDYDSSPKAYESFLSTLYRMPHVITRAMQNGIDFENMITSYCDDKPIEPSKWSDAAKSISEIVKGGQFQVPAKKSMIIDDMELLLYGRLDCLKAGVIYDMKFTSSYKVGKYYYSPQHPMYMEIVPEAQMFQYLISNGKDVWIENYNREECEPIKSIIHDFIIYLKGHGLFDKYMDIWESKY